MAGVNSLEDRVIELETRLAYQEHAIDDLSRIIQRQNQEIDILRKALLQLRDRIALQSENGRPSPQDEKPPPHY